MRKLSPAPGIRCRRDDGYGVRKSTSGAAKTPDSKREPRRSFYVGLTRPRHEVHMTYFGFTVNKSDKRFYIGPSKFILEVHKRLQDSW
jgi:superfamily I DNA/RNA helicase